MDFLQVSFLMSQNIYQMATQVNIHNFEKVGVFRINVGSFSNVYVPSQIN